MLVRKTLKTLPRKNRRLFYIWWLGCILGFLSKWFTMHLAFFKLFFLCKLYFFNSISIYVCMHMVIYYCGKNTSGDPPLKFYSTVLLTTGMKVYGRSLELFIFHTCDFISVEPLPIPLSQHHSQFASWWKHDPLIYESIKLHFTDIQVHFATKWENS